MAPAPGKRATEQASISFATPRPPGLRLLTSPCITAAAQGGRPRRHLARRAWHLTPQRRTQEEAPPLTAAGGRWSCFPARRRWKCAFACLIRVRHDAMRELARAERVASAAAAFAPVTRSRGDAPAPGQGRT